MLVPIDDICSDLNDITNITCEKLDNSHRKLDKDLSVTKTIIIDFNNKSQKTEQAINNILYKYHKKYNIDFEVQQEKYDSETWGLLCTFSTEN